MSMRTYGSKIVLDSISIHEEGIDRITTFETTMPKWLVAEFNTHRMFARNSASSRAIPTSRIIREVMENPVIPIDFRSKNTGMAAGVKLTDLEHEKAKYYWLKGRDLMVSVVKNMMEIGDGGIDKQRVNRLLEPWMWTVIVSTATEYDNFWARRARNDFVQPEFGYVADIMLDLYEKSYSIENDWHYPYAQDMPCAIDGQGPANTEFTVRGEQLLVSSDALVSAARCGRVSYYNQGESDKRTVQDDILRGIDFIDKWHMSPIEHPCWPTPGERHGPFIGWKPLRSFITGESGSDR